MQPDRMSLIIRHIHLPGQSFASLNLHPSATKELRLTIPVGASENH